MINIASPDIGPEEIASVDEVLKSGILAQGPKVAQLEKDFAAYCGTRYAAALNSGTAAIHSALHVAGVGSGDEVITTPFSFIATINPIVFLGAKPVLVDIDPRTFNIDPAQIEQAITSKTKAIMPVHLYGQMCDYDEIKAIAKQHSLQVIEDACQAIGAEYKRKKAGGLGNAGCFSLYATKNIMSGEGGIVTTNNASYIEKIKQFRQHGMSGPYKYEDIGYNFRMTDLQAAIAIEQLKKVDEFNNRRNKIASMFDVGLKSIEELEIPNVGTDRTHVYHQYTIRVTKDFPVSRDEFVVALKEKGVGTGVYYPKALHEIPHIAVFGYSVGDFPETERAAREVLSLPVHPKVSDSDVEHIIDSIKEIANA